MHIRTLCTTTLYVLLTLSLVSCAYSPRTSEKVSKIIDSDTGEEIICERRPKVGSHFKEIICLTKKEREQLRSEARDFVERVSAPRRELKDY